MTPEQAAAVFQKVCAYTSQFNDENAPRAWAEAMQWTDFEDALLAVRNLGMRPAEPGKTSAIAPGNVLWEVGRIRDRRVAEFDASRLSPPPGLSVGEYMGWLRGARELAASGREPVQSAGGISASPDFIASLRNRELEASAGE